MVRKPKLEAASAALELSARDSEPETVVSGKKLYPIGEVQPSTRQARTIITEEMIEAKARSIDADGQQEPIKIYRDTEGVLRIKDGEVRWNAMKQRGYKEIEAVEVEPPQSDEALFEYTLIDSLLKQSLVPYDRVWGVFEYVSTRMTLPVSRGAEKASARTGLDVQVCEFMATVRRLASAERNSQVNEMEPTDAEVYDILARLNQPAQSMSANDLAYLSLPDELVKYIRNGVPGKTVLNSLKISEGELRVEFLERCLDDSLSFRQAEALMKSDYLQSSDAPGNRASTSTDPEALQNGFLSHIQAIATRKITRETKTDAVIELEARKNELKALIEAIDAKLAEADTVDDEEEDVVTDAAA